jgi:hypothetical protein
MWEQLQGRVQNMRAEFNMQRTHAALVEVKRLKNLEKEGAAQQKKKELAEAIEFQKEAAKSKEGRRALAKLTHVTVCLALCLRTFIHLSACCVCTGCRVIVSAGGAV